VSRYVWATGIWSRDTDLITQPPTLTAFPAPGAFPTQPSNGALPPRPYPPPDAIQASLDDLIAGVQKEAPAAAKESKKKDKNMRLIYNDDFTSPEEKMTALPRFAQYARQS
jgi:hypothetical protein